MLSSLMSDNCGLQTYVADGVDGGGGGRHGYYMLSRERREGGIDQSKRSNPSRRHSLLASVPALSEAGTKMVTE